MNEQNSHLKQQICIILQAEYVCATHVTSIVNINEQYENDTTDPHHHHHHQLEPLVENLDA